MPLRAPHSDSSCAPTTGLWRRIQSYSRERRLFPLSLEREDRKPTKPEKLVEKPMQIEKVYAQWSCSIWEQKKKVARIRA